MVIEFENDTKKSHSPSTRFTAEGVYSSFDAVIKLPRRTREKVFNGKQYSEIQIFEAKLFIKRSHRDSSQRYFNKQFSFIFQSNHRKWQIARWKTTTQREKGLCE
jgi:hypothetical protein